MEEGKTTKEERRLSWRTGIKQKTRDKKKEKRRRERRRGGGEVNRRKEWRKIKQ